MRIAICKTFQFSLEIIAYSDAIYIIIINFVPVTYRNYPREMNHDFHQFHSSQSNRLCEINFSEIRSHRRFASSIKRNRVKAVNSYKKNLYTRLRYNAPLFARNSDRLSFPANPRSRRLSSLPLLSSEKVVVKHVIGGINRLVRIRVRARVPRINVQPMGK